MVTCLVVVVVLTVVGLCVVVVGLCVVVVRNHQSLNIPCGIGAESVKANIPSVKLATSKRSAPFIVLQASCKKII